MKSMMKDAIILFVITVVTGALLGVVYQITKAPIAAQEEATRVAACNVVFAQAAEFPELSSFDTDSANSCISGMYPAESIDNVLEAKDSSGNTLGYVLTVTTSEGYGGNIQFMMGVTNDGTLNGISLLSISETAGLGMQAPDVLVPQFSDKKVISFSYTKNGSTTDSEIDAISGATITTNAIVNGVNAGLYYFYNGLGGN